MSQMYIGIILIYFKNSEMFPQREKGKNLVQFINHCLQILFLTDYFLEQFLIHSKTEQTIQFHIPSHFINTVSSTINVPHQSGTFVTVDEPTQTCHYYPKAIEHMRFTRAGVHSMCLEKCIMTSMHHQ